MLLPDDTVLTTGGSSGYRGPRATQRPAQPAVYDAETDGFNVAAAPPGGPQLPLRGAAAAGRPGHHDGQRPALRRRGDRPRARSSSASRSTPRRTCSDRRRPARRHRRPGSVQRGTTVSVATPDADRIRTARLVRPSAVTHVTDVDQRSVALDITGRRARGAASRLHPDLSRTSGPGALRLVHARSWSTPRACRRPAAGSRSAEPMARHLCDARPACIGPLCHRGAAGAAVAVALLRDRDRAAPPASRRAAPLQAPLLYVDPAGAAADRPLAPAARQGRTARRAGPAAADRRRSPAPPGSPTPGAAYAGPGAPAGHGRHDAGKLPVLVSLRHPATATAPGTRRAARRTLDAYRSWVALARRARWAPPALVVLEPDAVAHAVEGCPGRAPSRATTCCCGRPSTCSRASAAPGLPRRRQPDLDRGPPALAAALRASGLDQAAGFALNVANFETTADNSSTAPGCPTCWAERTSWSTPAATAPAARRAPSGTGATRPGALGTPPTTDRRPAGRPPLGQDARGIRRRLRSAAPPRRAPGGRSTPPSCSASSTGWPPPDPGVRPGPHCPTRWGGCRCRR